MTMPVMTAQRRELSRLVEILPDDQVQATLDYVLQRFDDLPLEDLEEYTLAAEAYAKYLRDDRPASTLEEVSKRLGLDD